MPGPLSPWPVSLNGIKLQAVPDPDLVDRDIDAAYSGQFVALDASKTLMRRDVPDDMNTFRRGAFFLRRHSERDDGGFAWAEKLFTHYENGITLSGLLQARSANDWPQTSGNRPNTAAIIDSKLFLGDLYCLTNAGWVFKFANADPTGTISYSPALDSFGAPVTPKVSLRPGYVGTAMVVFAKSTGEPALYVFAWNSSTSRGRVYEYALSNAGSHWAESAADWTVKKVDKANTVWWEGTNGVGAQRLVVAASSTAVSNGITNLIYHCPLGSDPTLEASYVSPITVGNPGYPITALPAAPQHVLPVKQNGIHDFNEIRSMNLTPSWEDTASYNVGSVAKILDGYLYVARGFGLARLPLSQLGVVHEEVMECGPSYGRQDGHPVIGQITTMADHNSDLLLGLFNHDTKTHYLGRAIPKERFRNDPLPGLLEGVNPLVHYWAEQVIPPSSNIGQIGTHMRVVAPTVTASPTIPSRTLYQWIFTADYPTTGTYNFNLYYAPLPISAGPVSLQASNIDPATHIAAFPSWYAANTSGTLFMTGRNWDDDLSTKIVRTIESLGQGISGGNSIEIKTRADVSPATMPDDTTWTSAGVIDADSDTLTPALGGEPTGKLIALKAGFVKAVTSLPILQALSVRAKVVRPTSEVRVLWVVLERNHKLTGNLGIDLRSPDATWTAITALQDVGKKIFIDERTGASSNVIVEQGIQYRRARVSINGAVRWRTIAKLELSQVS